MRTSNGKARILNFLSEYIDQHGYAPSAHEIAKGVGFASPSTVHHHLRSLQEDGAISMDGGKSRTIKINESPCMSDVVFQKTVSEVLKWFEKNVSESCTDCAKSHDFSCSGANAERCRAFRVAVRLCKEKLN